MPRIVGILIDAYSPQTPSDNYRLDMRIPSLIYDLRGVVYFKITTIPPGRLVGPAANILIAGDVEERTIYDDKLAYSTEDTGARRGKNQIAWSADKLYARTMRSVRVLRFLDSPCPNPVELAQTRSGRARVHARMRCAEMHRVGRGWAGRRVLWCCEQRSG
ncbi:hypothetical protein B0H19DRAFT_1384689 [Mycena capillaripes]|nr:hypothetical protein B0H19DRAFT_1384689 [Mycena capillaripes]